VLDVLLRERGDADGDAGQVEALVVADPSPGLHLGEHVLAVDLDDLEPDLAVVDEDRVAGAYVAREAVVRRPADAQVPGHVAGGDGEPVTRLQGDRTVGEG